MPIHPKLREVIETVKDSESLGDSIHAEYTRIRKELIFNTSVENEQDKRRYRRFLEIIKNEDYFHIDQVNSLGLKWDILIFMSKKGSGKSHWMREAINNIVDNGGEVFLIRVLDGDVRNGLRGLLSEPKSHVELKGNSDFKLYHKTLKDPNDPKKPLFVGYASGMNTAAKYKGGGFPNLKAIFFDEITDDRKGKWTKEDVEIFFSHVANSLERNKEIPMILFGNVDQKTTTENPILSCLGISSMQHFKYIERQVAGAEKPTRILYINSQGMYKEGINKSKLAGASVDAVRQIQMQKNAKFITSSKYLVEDLIPFGEPWFIVVFPMNSEILSIIVTIDNNGTDEEEEYWATVKIEPFNPSYTADFKQLKYTDNPVIYNQYTGVVEWMHSCWPYWQELEHLLMSGRVIVSGGTEQNLLFARIMEERKSFYSRLSNPLKPTRKK